MSHIKLTALSPGSPLRHDEPEGSVKIPSAVTRSNVGKISWRPSASTHRRRRGLCPFRLGMESFPGGI